MHITISGPFDAGIVNSRVSDTTTWARLKYIQIFFQTKSARQSIYTQIEAKLGDNKIIWQWIRTDSCTQVQRNRHDGQRLQIKKWKRTHLNLLRDWERQISPQNQWEQLAWHGRLNLSWQTQHKSSTGGELMAFPFSLSTPTKSERRWSS